MESNGCSYALSEQSVLHVYFLKWSQHALGVTLCLVIYASVLSLSQQELVFMWEIWSWSIMLLSLVFKECGLLGGKTFLKSDFCAAQDDMTLKRSKWSETKKYTYRGEELELFISMCLSLACLRLKKKNVKPKKVDKLFHICHAQLAPLCIII